MKIVKYKKVQNSRYKIYLENGEELTFYEDVILKYHLLIRKHVSDKLIEEMNKSNRYFEVYYVGLRYIRTRFRSAYDIRTLLIKQGYEPEYVDIVIEKLIKQGYINDSLYAKSFINNRIVTTNYGPKKIKNELIQHGVDTEIIDKAMIDFDDSIQLEKIEKMAHRSYRSNKSRGGEVLKRKITTDLVNLGYSIELIDIVIDKLDYTPNDEIAKKEYEKLYKKLSRKYKGEELERKIKEKLYLKGLKYEIREEE